MASRDTRTNAVTFRSLLGLALLAAGGVLYAGPLNPPAGPVTSTYKTLTEIEPRIAINATNTPGDSSCLFKISQPGSYYLTGNITGVVGKHGIKIAANSVTLDLNGFELLGVLDMGAYDGVYMGLTGLNVAVVNGTVRGWGDDGVDLASLFQVNCRVDGVRASANADDGISVPANSMVSNCSVHDNTGNGISAGISSTVSHCNASTNAGNGISVGGGCTITNCTAYGNTVNGIATNSGSTVTDCSAYQNTVYGISVSTSCTITNCTAYSNATGGGITTGSGTTVTNCTAYDNTGNGIVTNTGSTVAGCTTRTNTLDGIVCLSQCVIRGNTCSSNGSGTGDGAGIHATSNDNRIEGNNCIGADRGIDVDVAGNLIIKNTCSGNTINWAIAANNVCGPILDRTAPASAAISGNSAPDSTGSTHPNANFTY